MELFATRPCLRPTQLLLLATGFKFRLWGSVFVRNVSDCKLFLFLFWKSQTVCYIFIFSGMKKSNFVWKANMKSWLNEQVNGFQCEFPTNHFHDKSNLSLWRLVSIINHAKWNLHAVSWYWYGSCHQRWDIPVDYVFENFTWILTMGNDEHWQIIEDC